MEVKCKTHPDAPHGFLRNASHSMDRYVCECEFWEEPVVEATIQLTRQQAETVTRDYLLNQLIVNKQYLDPDEIKHYKYFIERLSNLADLDAAVEKFNRAWPQDITWDVFMVG